MLGEHFEIDPDRQYCFCFLTCGTQFPKNEKKERECVCTTFIENGGGSKGIQRVQHILVDRRHHDFSRSLGLISSHLNERCHRPQLTSIKPIAPQVYTMNPS